MDFYPPQAAAVPNILQSYLQGRMAPGQIQEQQNTLAEQQQQLQAGQLNIQQLRMAMQLQQMRAQNAQQYLGDTQTAGAQNVGAPTGGVQQGPQGDVGAPTGGAWSPSGNGSPLDQLADPKRIAAGVRYNQFNAALSGGDPNKALEEGIDIQAKAREQQMKQAQTNALANPKSPLPTLRAFANNPNAGDALLKNPNLIPQWAQLAASVGADPKDLSNANVMRVSALAANQIEAPIGLPLTKVAEVYSKPEAGPDGSILQTNLASGKQDTVVGRKSPFANVDDASVEEQAKAIAEYRQAPFSGVSARSPQASAVMKMVYQMNPQYDATNFEAKKKAYDQFTSGKNGNTVRSLSVATSHLDQLEGLVGALNNGDVQAFNKLGNAFAAQTGSTAPTNFNAAKKIVADEVVKAIVGSGGGVADREEASKSISSAQSPQQLLGVIKTYKGLMGGQLEGLQRQYEKATGRSDFQDFVSKEAQQELEGKKSGPQAGDVVKGYRFKGGNPADKNNWEKAGG